MKRRNFLKVSGIFPFVAQSLAAAPLVNDNSTSAPNDLPPAKDFFYKPADAWAADFIPLFAEGKFQLFYLLDWRDAKKHGEGTPWYRISTTDFVNFEEHGEMIPRGTKEEQDLYVFTGSAIKAKDKYHIFYTGNNGYMNDKGKPTQAVMHAVSDDLQHWTKFLQILFMPLLINMKKMTGVILLYSLMKKQRNTICCSLPGLIKASPGEED